MLTLIIYLIGCIFSVCYLLRDTGSRNKRAKSIVTAAGYSAAWPIILIFYTAVIALLFLDSRAKAVRNSARKLRCWWFGCEAHPQESYYRDDNFFSCIHCGNEASYSDLVGDTRHNRLKEAAQYWLWNRWIPAKCSWCQRRWRSCDESMVHGDDIPF